MFTARHLHAGDFTVGFRVFLSKIVTLSGFEMIRVHLRVTAGKQADFSQILQKVHTSNILAQFRPTSYSLLMN